MMHYYKRCQHCGETYAYQASGWGCQEDLNDDRYCPQCMEKILKALSKIPQAKKKVWEPSTTYDRETFLKIVAGKEEEWKKKKLLKESLGTLDLSDIMVRVYPARFNAKDPEDKNITGEVKIEDITYFFNYWTKRKDFDLAVAMEYDCKENKIIGYWREYR